MDRSRLISWVRRLCRFRLATLLWLVLAAAVLCGWLADRRRLERQVHERDDRLSAYKVAARGNEVGLGDTPYLWSSSPLYFVVKDVRSWIGSLQDGTNWTEMDFEFEPTSLADDVLPVVVECLSQAAPEVRRRAASALGNIGPTQRRHVVALVRALRDEHALVSLEAARALHRWKEKVDRVSSPPIGCVTVTLSFRLLAKAVRNKHDWLDLTPHLIHLLSHEHAEARAIAAEFLGSLDSGTEEAVPGLLSMLKEEDARCRQAAAGALANMTSQEAVISALLLAFKEEPCTEARTTMARAITELDRRQH